MLTVRRSELPPLPTPRAFHTGAVVGGGRVVLVGGSRRQATDERNGVCETQCWSIPDVAIVDPGVGAVAVGPALCAPRQDALIQFVEGVGLLVAGGHADYG